MTPHPCARDAVPPAQPQERPLPRPAARPRITQLLGHQKITGKSDSYMAPVRDGLLLTPRLCA